MSRPFEPIVRNPHFLTIAGNFWPRKIDLVEFPLARKQYQIDARTTIVSFEHQPRTAVLGQIVLLHGLEGSAEAGYVQSFCQEALQRGFSVHRLNLRSCGGTEELCETMYHSGLTSDTRFIVHRIRERWSVPVFLCGFSLGGNVALKLAGELGETDLLQGVCAISTPIDLSACVDTLDKRSNRLYARRFLGRLRQRVRRKSKLFPHIYTSKGLSRVRTIREFDDRFTAPLFGFGTAANYYATQSASAYLDGIRIPTLLVCAKDDPLIPFAVYNHRAFQNNPALKLIAPEHGGHLGFLSRSKPRFWADGVALDWIEELLSSRTDSGTNSETVTSVRESFA